MILGNGAMLCGSLPVSSTSEAFDTVLPILGRWLRRIPDGEPNDRSRWARWQAPVIRRLAAQQSGRGSGTPAFDPELLGELGYAAAAIDSYGLLLDRRRSGAASPDVRLQVSLPTPFAVAALNVEPDVWDVVLPVYHDAMMAELKTIFAAIPATELAIQWDVAVEIFRFFGADPPLSPLDAEGLLAKLTTLGEAIPAEVELGFHLCYGDNRRMGYRSPDSTVLAGVAQQLLNRVQRQINWIHVPVHERANAAWFSPLAGLDRGETELYLGLVRLTDGLSECQRKVAAAAACQPFGVATPCGLGRVTSADGGSPANLRKLLDLHASLASPVR
jgi:hypothetical protein